MPRRRMIVWIALAAIAGAIALVVVGRSVAGARPVVRDLLELGTIAVPARLESRRADESPERVLFHFDRVAGGFTMMGSHTPIRERLAVAVFPNGAAQSAGEREFRGLAIERVEDVAWQTDGEWQIGSGTHRVNTHEAPAIVLIRTLPGRGLTLGYMAWRKDASLDEAKAMLDRIAISYAPMMDRDAFFAVVRHRPAKLRAERRAFLAGQLAAQGVSLDADERLAEHDGIAYFLSPRWKQFDGAWFFAMTPIGTLPASVRPLRHHRPSPVEGLWAWPGIIYYAWQDGAWQKRTTDLEYTPPPALQPWIDAQLTDPSRAYFFAAHGIAVDETDTSQFGLDLLWKAPPHMRTLLAEGKLVYPAE